MKRTHLMMILGFFITLIFMQLSCGTLKEHPAGDVPAEVEEEAVVVEASLLADKHKIAGIECNDCHEEAEPNSSVPQAVCLTCHEDYRDVATSYLDPHNAHVSYSDCGDCHHAHRQGERICQGCHSFNLQAP